MKTRILITAILTLAAPVVQAFSWKECFQKPDKFYTEYILSEEERPNQAIIDEFYDHKEKMEIGRFVILKKAVLNTQNQEGHITKAHTMNNLFSSTVTIDELRFKNASSQGRAWKNTIDLMHELIHVQKDHCGKDQTRQNLKHSVMYASMLTCGRVLAKQGTLFTTIAGSLLQGIGTIAAGATIYKTVAPQPEEEQKELQQWEYEAEVGARNAAAECGYCDVLKKALKETELDAKQKNDHFIHTHRPQGIYPTLAEKMAMERTALAQCRAKKQASRKIKV